jgi:hypothetical protein
MKIIKIILGVCMLVSAMGCTSQKNLVRGMDELVQKPSGPLVTPIWASSGDHVAASYIAYTEHRSTIYDFELKTHKSTILTSIEGKAVAQSWSMDESHLAITISESITFSNDGIWVFNIADSSYNYIGIGEAASWSPNGKFVWSAYRKKKRKKFFSERMVASNLLICLGHQIAKRLLFLLAKAKRRNYLRTKYL